MPNQKSSLRHIAIYGTYKGKSSRYELELNPDNPNDVKAVELALEHPPKKRFFRNVVLGDWDADIVKLELDRKYSLRRTKAIAEMLSRRYALEGYIILLSSNSSENIWDEAYSKIVYKHRVANWHIVFNRCVSWSKFISILAWLSLRLHDPDFDLWFKMQCVKQTCTLRHGCKGRKKAPRIVYHSGAQDKGIAMFLLNRDFINKLERGEA